jgi:hypothetical protein
LEEERRGSGGRAEWPESEGGKNGDLVFENEQQMGGKLADALDHGARHPRKAIGNRFETVWGDIENVAHVVDGEAERAFRGSNDHAHGGRRVGVPGEREQSGGGGESEAQVQVD